MTKRKMAMLTKLGEKGGMQLRCVGAWLGDVGQE